MNLTELQVDRYLAPYGPRIDPDKVVSAAEFVQRIIETVDWYGLMSPFGTGKSTLIKNTITLLQQGDNHPVIALYPLDLAKYRGQSDPTKVLHNIAVEIATRLEAQHQPVAEEVPPLESISALFDGWLSRVVAPLERAGRPARVLVSLDGFQHLESEVRRSLPEHLRNLHAHSAAYLTCLIATDSNLKTTGRDVSALRGILQLVTLLDYSRREEWEQVEEGAKEQGAKITREGWKAIQEATGGYPYWVAELLRCIAGSKPRARWGAAEVDEVIDEFVTAEAQPQPVTVLLDTIETWAKQLMPEHAAIAVLADLLHSTLPITADEATAEPLVLKGVARFDEAGLLTWRNPLIEKFLRTHENEIVQWTEPEKRPGHRLRPRGKVRVTLIMNFSRFVHKADKRSFECLRATEEFESGLEDLERQVQTGSRSLNKFEIVTTAENWRNEDELQNVGTDLYIFTRQAAEGAFAPVYYLKNAPWNYLASSTFKERLGKREALSPDVYEEVIKQEWKRWDHMSVQLTREGTAVVRLIKEVGHRHDPAEHEGSRMFSALENVLGLEQEIPLDNAIDRTKTGAARDAQSTWRAAEPALPVSAFQKTQEYRRHMDRSVQWEIAMRLVEGLLCDLFHPSPQPDGAAARIWEVQAERLHLAPGGRPIEGDDPIYPLHDRYVLYEFDKICDCVDEKTAHILKSQDLREPNRALEIAGLLEGVAVEHPGGQGFPTIKTEQATRLLENDLSSWQTETCLISVDNAFLFYARTEPDLLPEGNGSRVSHPAPGEQPVYCSQCYIREKPTIHEIYFPGRQHVSYETYWHAVIRGLEYIVGLRMAAQLISNRTRNYLAEAADLMQKDKPPAARASELRENVANASRLLSLIRGAAIPLSIARSDYAAHKFDSLIAQSGIRESIASAEANLRDLNAFLAHLDESNSLREVVRLTDSTLASNIAAISTAIVIGIGLAVTTSAQILSAVSPAPGSAFRVLDWTSWDQQTRELIVFTWVAVALIIVVCSLVVFGFMKWTDLKYKKKG